MPPATRGRGSLDPRLAAWFMRLALRLRLLSGMVREVTRRVRAFRGNILMRRAVVLCAFFALLSLGGFSSVAGSGSGTGDSGSLVGIPAAHAADSGTAPSTTSLASPDSNLPDRTRAALTEAIRSLDIQANLPDAAPIRPIEPTKPPKFNFSLDLPTLSIARIVLWIAIGLLLITLVLALKDNLWSFSRSRTIRPDARMRAEITPVAVTARMEEARGEADTLASQGLYAEAMHVLLLQSVSELRRRLDLSIAASLTSREILRHVELPPEGEDAFGDIVSRVEISYFGFHTPDEHDYHACRASFAALTRALGGPAPMTATPENVAEAPARSVPV